MRFFPTFLLLFIAQPDFGQTRQKNPAFEEVGALRQVSSPRVSPDGRQVVFQLRTTDWKTNQYDTELWLAKNGAAPFQLTRTKDGSSTAPQWSPDGRWIAFLAKRDEKTQIFVLRAEGGEAFPATNAEENVQSYAWSPDGKQFAYLSSPKERKSEKSEKDRYGAFEIDDEEYKQSWLYAVDFDPDRPGVEELPCYNEKDSALQKWPCLKWSAPRALVDSVPFTVVGFEWSPDGSNIAFQHQPNPLINSAFDADIALVDVKTKARTSLVQNAGADGLLTFSPDGQYVLYSTDGDNRTSNFYTNDQYFKIPVKGGMPMRIAADFDEFLSDWHWTETGLYAVAFQKTVRRIFKIDPQTGVVKPFGTTPALVNELHMPRNGRYLTFTGSDAESLSEVYTSDAATFAPKTLTNLNAQIKDWKIAKSEVISWKSRDGARIEGVLHKPWDYDPAKKYPLLVVIHGGPTGIDLPGPVPGSVYPILQWLNKGALVLRPNYRGSAGYGAQFRALNVENLGVGDAWDVHSGVDELARRGLIDTTRMGAMGWSQGGYISAFLTTTTGRFKAISVGAGISNWMTYYVNTDIHPFTRQYLKATPWDNEAVYKKTSPMTYINGAKTPTLIQHGEFDRRVPIANAYELLQGLRDRNVPARLVVYKGFGHGINKPKERLAAMWHNWQWFNQYIWGEETVLPVEK